MSELDQMLQKLLTLRHDALDAIYHTSSDSRALAHSLGGNSDPEKLLMATLQADSGILARRPELSEVVRDSKCRLAVMWFVHHLPESTRTRALQLLGSRLPLLPKGGVDFVKLLAQSGDADERTALKAYENRSVCLPCHIDGSESPSPAPPAPVPGHTGPALARWPDSVNYKLYAGMTGCCSSSNNFTEIRQITRRWKHKQQLDVNTWVDCQTSMKPSFVHECKGGGFSPEDRTCMLDPCHSGENPEYAQRAGCHFFYNGSEIWEFWPALRRCTKLIAGAGMPPPWGLPSSLNVIGDKLKYYGFETIADVPDVTKNRTCHKWCKPTPAFSPVCYWMHEDGTPCKHHFPGGIDFYGSSTNGDWLEVEDDGPILTELPDYCPPADTPALLQAEFPNQENVCTGWWWNSSVPKSMYV